jgi:DNA polymerase-1
LVNIHSTLQLRELFFGEAPKGMGLDSVKNTGKGVPSTDESVLKILASEGVDMASMVLRARKLHKILGTYVNALLAMSELHTDGRVHPSFNQIGARTGRLSTSNPNSQNMPRPDNDEFGIRTMFVASPGHKLIVGDYAQLEMRIMAHFSRDRNMLKAIRDGMDLHCFTVSLMHNVPYEEVIEAVRQKDLDKDRMTDRQKWLIAQRQAAKVIGFGLLYGAGARRTAEELGIEEDEAQDKIDKYFAGFPGVYQYIKDTRNLCKDAGFVETLVGRRRRLPDIQHHNRQFRAMAQRESVNSVIQGTAADITKTAMLVIEKDEQLNEMGAWLLNQIHDEVVIEIPEEYAAEALPIIKHHMEFPFDGNQPLVVPTPTDFHVVDNWAEAK